MKYSYIPWRRGGPVPFSACITDVIIKAGITQYTLWFDCHRTPIFFFRGILPAIFFSFNPEALLHLERPKQEGLAVLSLGRKKNQQTASCKNGCNIAAPLAGDAEQLGDGTRLQPE